MKAKITGIVTAAMVLIWGFAGIAKADIVKLNLFDLGCPTEFNFDSPYWQTEFDLGVTFIEISNTYMEWSGEVTAGLGVNLEPPVSQPFPLEDGIIAWLEGDPWPHFADFYGGETTYPNPEVFDEWSKFDAWGTTWSYLLGGQGTISVGFAVKGGLVGYIEYGFVELEKINLVFEGRVVPEPATILFIAVGTFWIRLKKSKRLHRFKTCKTPQECK